MMQYEPIGNSFSLEKSNFYQTCPYHQNTPLASNYNDLKFFICGLEFFHHFLQLVESLYLSIIVVSNKFGAHG